MRVELGIIILSVLGHFATSSDVREWLDLDIPVLASPVMSDGRSMVAFEVHATNFSTGPLELRGIRITDAHSGQQIAAHAGEAFARRVRLLGGVPEATLTTLAAGGRAVLYLELDLAVPTQLRALTIEIECVDPSGRLFTLRSVKQFVDRVPVPVLAPPLKNGPWVAVHDPSWERGHRRMIYTLGGRARVPGRYAVDWVGVDDGGRTSRGDADRPADAVGYDTPVLSVADAVVAFTRDDMREAGSIARNPAHPLGDGSGNYVVLRLSENRFAFYEHLRPGSISVRPGDRVRVGQKIGALGFTGDTTGPHLHLHVADCASPLACEGVPFAIRGMTTIGRYGDAADLGRKLWQEPRARGRIVPEWPGYNVVVRFSG